MIVGCAWADYGQMQESEEEDGKTVREKRQAAKASAAASIRLLMPESRTCRQLVRHFVTSQVSFQHDQDGWI